MKTLQGPAIFLAQFAGDEAPFNSLPAIAEWAAGLGYVGVQIPTWDSRLFDLAKAAESDAYCDEIKGVLEAAGLQATELSTHLQGQLVAVHPAYDEGFDAFAPDTSRPRQAEGRARAWGEESGEARRQGLAAAWGSPSHVDLLGCSRMALHLFLAAAPAGPHRGPPSTNWPAAGSRMLDTFDNAWRRTSATSSTPARTSSTASTFEMFLERAQQPSALPRSTTTRAHFVLQQLDYLDFIDIYHERIKMPST